MWEQGDKAGWATFGGDKVGNPRGGFASPFRDISSRFAPRTMKDALYLCEYLYVNYGIYRKSSERIVDYFLTKPIFKGQDDKEREKFEKLMKGDFGLMRRMQDVGYDRQCYGNSFLSMQMPFTRALRCVQCKSEKNMITRRGEVTPFEFRPDYTFYMRCEKCKRIQRCMVHEYANRDAKKIQMARWDPKRITIEMNPFSMDARYWLDIDPELISKVRRGDPWILATTPWSVIQAIKNNQKYLFDNDYFLHLRESSLAGLHMGGWGIPSILSAFKNFFRLQVLYRYDETMKMDYIVPLRILSPAENKVQAGNDLMNISMGSFTQHAQQAVRRHRVDGADWNFFPFPVNYQAIGGEGAQLDQSTRDTISAEEDRLLNTRGIPPELYRGTLTLQNAPVGLRLFEAGHTALVADLNKTAQFASNAVARWMQSGDHEVELERCTITDNLDDKAWRLQAAMSGAISKETGLSPLGIDAEEEEVRVIQEQIRQQKAQQKAQQDAQMEAMSLDTQNQQAESGQSQGGMTPMDIESQGEESAKQLLDPTLPESNRRQQLAALRNSNPTLHAVVIKKMEELRGRAGTAGQAAGLQAMGIGQKQGHLSAWDVGPDVHQLARVRRSAEMFFPPKRAHRVHLTPDSSRLALYLDLEVGTLPIFLKESDLQGNPFDFMVKTYELLERLGVSFGSEA